MRQSAAGVLAALFVLGHGPAFAQEKLAAQPKWDVNAPQGATLKQAEIDTDEGTWIDVDVSPDGRTIAFALLGDIYTMPITGGTPTRISEGLAWEVHPRFSPDGSRIAFTSDRGGGDNIWIMNRDGSDKRQLTKEDFRLLNQPSWSPDGQYIVAKKHFTTGRSLGTGEVWLYHVSGGAGVQLVKRPNERHQKELGEPTYSPDGKSVYFTRNVTAGPVFEYAQDSNTNLFSIERYDLESGEISTAVSGLGGSVRPAPSPDGKQIAFVRRDAGKSQLWVKDIASGVEKRVYADLDLDVQETWAVTGVYPNIAWTPDNKSLVFWAGGKIRRANVDGSGATIIPFHVHDTRAVADAPHPQIEVAPDSFTTKMPRFASVSPDGSRVVFESLGKLWVKPLAGGTAKRLTTLTDTAGFELFPSWSRDGRSIVFVQWSDETLGSIRTVAANGGAAREVTRTPGHYARPQFAPDGKTIVFERKSGGFLVSPKWGENAGVYRVASAGGEAVLVAKGASRPQFGSSSDRLFMVEGGEKLTLVSTDLNGGAKRTHASGEMANDFIVAPDGKSVAFRQNYQVFAMPLMPGGQAVTVGPKADALPVVRVSGDGGDYINWSGDGTRLHWSLGPTLYSVDRSQFFANAPGVEKSKITPRMTSMAMTVQAVKPSGTIALTGARIVTMASNDGGIIDNGTILIQADSIVAVGAAGTVTIPADAKTVDVTGKTIMPGLVDAHAHGPYGQDELIPQQNWSLVQNLALGTTTLHDPSSRAAHVFAAAELQQTGRILAPRLFSTGEIVYGAKAAGVYAEINSYDDALNHVRRLKAQGAYSVKNYNQPRREQRQMVVAAARAEGMQVVAEGGSLFGMDMNLIVDGNSTLEHNIPADVFYKDVIQLFGQSDTNYTPTLTVTYGGLAGDPYWRQATNVWENPLMVHTPPAQLRADTQRVTKAPEHAFVDDNSAREAKKIMDAGKLVAIGAHGQQAGIGAHWELWSFVRGGMTPIEALRVGTIDSAKSLGYAKDVGSLEVGKLADLLVLDADPTSDIRNSDKIHRVMLGGRIYDPKTMHEAESGTAKRRAYYWE